MDRIIVEEGVMKRLCRRKRCGAVVESTLSTVFNTSINEVILCPSCGADNSLRPSLGQRLRLGLRRMRRRRMALGSLYVGLGFTLDCFKPPAERGRGR